MKILVILALSAFCVSAEELVRSKRGWSYEPTPPPPPPPTQPPGGWGPPPPPPPPPTNPPQPGGWGPPPQPPTSRPGWGWPQPQPTPGWGSSSYNCGYNYPSYNNYGLYPRRWGQTRYNRYAEMERERPSRYSDFSTIRGGSEPYRRSSSLM